MRPVGGSSPMPLTRRPHTPRRRPSSFRISVFGYRISTPRRLYPVMPSHPWYLLESGSGDCAFNMALDDALLQAAARLGRPILRFYGWIEPAASFGYFQRYAQVEQMTQLRPLVRWPGASRGRLDLQPGLSAERRLVLTERHQQLPAGPRMDSGCVREAGPPHRAGAGVQQDPARPMLPRTRDVRPAL